MFCCTLLSLLLSMSLPMQTNIEHSRNLVSSPSTLHAGSPIPYTVSENSAVQISEQAPAAQTGMFSGLGTVAAGASKNKPNQPASPLPRLSQTTTCQRHPLASATPAPTVRPPTTQARPSHSTSPCSWRARCTRHVYIGRLFARYCCYWRYRGGRSHFLPALIFGHLLLFVWTVQQQLRGSQGSCALARSWNGRDFSLLSSRCRSAGTVVGPGVGVLLVV